MTTVSYGPVAISAIRTTPKDSLYLNNVDEPAGINCNLVGKLSLTRNVTAVDGIQPRHSMSHLNQNTTINSYSRELLVRGQITVLTRGPLIAAPFHSKENRQTIRCPFDYSMLRRIYHEQRVMCRRISTRRDLRLLILLPTRLIFYHTRVKIKPPRSIIMFLFAFFLLSKMYAHQFFGITNIKIP